MGGGIKEIDLLGNPAVRLPFPCKTGGIKTGKEKLAGTIPGQHEGARGTTNE